MKALVSAVRDRLGLEGRAVAGKAGELRETVRRGGAVVDLHPERELHSDP